MEQKPFINISVDAQRSRDGSQKRSAIDLIMNQIRRKTSFTERRQKPVGFLFKPGENNDRKNGGIPEMKESDNSEGKNTESGAGELNLQRHGPPTCRVGL